MLGGVQIRGGGSKSASGGSISASGRSKSACGGSISASGVGPGGPNLGGSKSAGTPRVCPVDFDGCREMSSSSLKTVVYSNL